MRQLIVVTVILLTVQVIKAGTIQPQTNYCGHEEDTDLNKLSREALRIKAKDCYAAKDRLSKDNAAIHLQSNQYKCSLDEATCTIARLDTENKSYKSDLIKAQESLKAQKKAHDNLRKSLDDSSKKLKDSNAELASCKTSLSTSQSKHIDLEQKNRKLTNDNKILSDKYEHDSRDWAAKKQSLQNTIDQLRCELNEEKRKRSRIEKELKFLKGPYACIASLVKCRADNERQRKYISDLGEKLKKEQLDDDIFALHIKEQSEQIEHLEIEWKKSEARYAELHTQFQCLKNDLENQEQEYKRRIHDLEESLRNEEIDCGCALEKLREENRALNKIISDQKQEIDNLNQELCRKQEALNNCEKELKECRDKIKILNDRINDLERENNKLRSDISEWECRYNDILAQLRDCEEREKKCQSDLEQCRKDLYNAQSEIARLNEFIAQLRNEKDQCDCDLEALRCATEQFTHKIQDDSQSLTADISSISKKSRSIFDIISAFRQDKSHKLGCNGLECGCEDYD